MAINDLRDTRNAFASALYRLLPNASVEVQTTKLEKMQSIYLGQNQSLYSETEIALIESRFNSLGYKFHLTNIALEQLWSLGHYKLTQTLLMNMSYPAILNNKDGSMIAVFACMENFLYQSRSFLDFFMLYGCALLKLPLAETKVTQKTFLNELDRLTDALLSPKAQGVKEYFVETVFCKYVPRTGKGWGTILTALRNEVAHRKDPVATFGIKDLYEDTSFQWPTIEGLLVEEFCQDLHNGLFFLIYDLSPILFGVPWLPGPYKAGMWEV